MIIFGVLLILLAVLVVLYVAFGAGDPSDATVRLEVIGIRVDTQPLVLFLSGAVTLVVLALGVALLRRGVLRSMRARSEMHRLRRIENEVAARQVADSWEPDREASTGSTGIRPPVPAPPADAGAAPGSGTPDPDDPEATRVTGSPDGPSTDRRET